jgi:hypothetical protein
MVDLLLHAEIYSSTTHFYFHRGDVGDWVNIMSHYWDLRREREALAWKKAN